MTDDGESGSTEGVEPFRPTLRDSEPAAGEDSGGLLDGFETGAGFDLEDVPDAGDANLEVEALEVTSSTFDEGELAEAANPADAGGADPASVDWYADRDRAADRKGDASTSADSQDPLPTLGDEEDPLPALGDDQPADDRPLLLPTDAVDEADEATSYSGLKRLERQKRRQSGGRFVMATTVIVLMAGGAGALMGFLGVVEIPGITPLDFTRPEVAAPVVLPGPQPETPVMSHVVLVDTWREAETPRAWAAALQEQNSELFGFVSALEIDGDRRYALVVGPAYSEAEANGLKGALETAFELLNPDPRSWTVRAVPYSFFFGEYEERGSADSRVQSLANLSIPAFVLQVGYPDGAMAFRVYGGAFSDQHEAAGMGELLGEHELGDTPLTERRGRLPE